MPRKRQHTGGYFRGEKWIAMTWGDKISESLKAAPRIDATCAGCGKSFQVARNARRTARWCSHECRYRAQYIDEDPIVKKAVIWGANIKFGKGKKEFLIGLIRAALGKFCRYCHDVLHIDNISIDHKEPFQGDRGNPLFHNLLDRAENLEVVCRDCNRRKGDFSDKEYERLLSFLGDPLNVSLRRKVFKRFGHTAMLAKRGWAK